MTIQETGNPEDGFIRRTKIGNLTLIEITPPAGHHQEHESPHGRYTSTLGSRELPAEDIHRAMARFNIEDWGEGMDPESIQVNDTTHRTGQGIIVGSYQSGQTEFWIHRRDREIPAVLLPWEY